MRSVVQEPKRSWFSGSPKTKTHTSKSKSKTKAAPVRLKGTGPVATQRVTMTALWALIGIGACSGVFALVTRPTVPNFVEVRPPAEAEGVGVRFVVSYLASRSGEELRQTVSAYMGTQAQSLVGLAEPRPVEIVSAFPVGGRRLAERYWSVTVGVSSEDAAMSYWTTSVRRTVNNGWIVVSLPSRVVDPAPLGDGTVRQLVQSGQLSKPDDPAVVTVQGWLDAYLTGTGSIDRFSLPGARFRPVVPTPYLRVEISRIGVAEAPQRRVVVVDVIGITPDGGRQPLQYSLELFARGPRWEVARTFDAPPLAGMQIAPIPTYVVPVKKKP
jgi:hypothetical protein